MLQRYIACPLCAVYTQQQKHELEQQQLAASKKGLTVAASVAAAPLPTVYNYDDSDQEDITWRPAVFVHDVDSSSSEDNDSDDFEDNEVELLEQELEEHLMQPPPAPPRTKRPLSDTHTSDGSDNEDEQHDAHPPMMQRTTASRRGKLERSQ